MVQCFLIAKSLSYVTYIETGINLAKLTDYNVTHLAEEAAGIVIIQDRSLVRLGRVATKAPTSLFQKFFNKDILLQLSPELGYVPVMVPI